MSFTAETRQRVRPVLPLAAMVDVLFLLLIFFMTASVFRDYEMQLPIEVPSAEAATGGSVAAPKIVVSIAEDGQIYLGQRAVSLETLGQTFVALAEQFPNEVVEVRGDQNSRYGLAIQVMDLAQQAQLQVAAAVVKPLDDIDRE